jgi:hypothetical protein
MRATLILGLISFVLAACCSCPPSQPTVVIPPGAAVVCPSGSPAVITDGVYHC